MVIKNEKNMSKNKKIGVAGDILVCTFIGVFIAGIVNYLFTNGIWIDNYIQAGQTITELMYIIVIMWIIVGFIIASVRRWVLNLEDLVEEKRES